MESGPSEEEIKSIIEERFTPTRCPKCSKTLWELGSIQMPSRTMKMRNLRIIKCAACGYATEW